MRRIYCMMPDRELCKTVVQELEEAGIPERHLHAVASMAVSLDGLPEATVMQTSELAHGIEKGVALGGVAGLLGGMLAIAFPPTGLVLGGGTVLLTAAAGAGFGGLATALFSKDIPSRKLEVFERDLDHGRILLLIDVPKKEVEKWKSLILSHHPDADIGVTTVPGR